MKKLLLILVVLSVVVMASGCTSSDPWSSNKTYSSNGVTFVYPASWSVNASSVTTPSGSDVIVSVGSTDEGFAIGNINVSDLPSASVLDMVNELVQQYKTQGYLTEKAVSVDGVNATMLTTQNKTSSGFYNSIAYWAKNSKLYYAVYVSKNNGTQTMDRILSSLTTT